MVRRRLTLPAVSCVVFAGALAAAACGRERDTAEHVELRDSMPVVRAMTDSAKRDSMLDTMPGGEMVRGNEKAAKSLLKKKM